MDTMQIYMLMVDGAVYITTKWGLKNLGIDKVVDDVVEGGAKTIGVKAGRAPPAKYLNDAVMFLGSKWLYKNYVYDMVVSMMPADGFINMPELRNSLGIAATMTLIRAFQGDASLKSFIEDSIAIGSSEWVSTWLSPYIMETTKDIVYQDKAAGGEGTKNQNLAKMNASGKQKLC